MRRNLIAIFMLLTFELTAVASAQAQSAVQAIITTPDPAIYSQQLADRMATEGVSALRPVLTQLYANQVRVPVASVQLPPQYEAQFTTMQGLIAGRHASLERKLDDVVTANTLRSIYYYHYYGDNIWIFTRFDFVRVADDRWAVSLVLWGGDQSVVGISPSPSQHSMGATSP
jgi:hypothetical protein